MKNKFCGESYSIGYIEANYQINKQISEQHAERYLYLCNKLGQQADENIVEYIKKNHKSLVESK